MYIFRQQTLDASRPGGGIMARGWRRSPADGATISSTRRKISELSLYHNTTN